MARSRTPGADLRDRWALVLTLSGLPWGGFRGASEGGSVSVVVTMAGGVKTGDSRGPWPVILCSSFTILELQYAPVAFVSRRATG